MVAEIILTSFLTALFDKLASAALIKLAQSARIYSDLQKWKNTLTQIQAVLVDAGQKHITQITVQQWLNTLQHLAYDIDDLLDDLETEAMRRHLNKRSDATTSTSTNKVLKTLAPYTPRNFKYGRKMRSKLDDITTRLDQLVRQIPILRLVENVDGPIRTSRRLEQTSLVDESKIVGREKDKEALLSKLLEDGSNDKNFHVVSIVGLGGIGKTTLAQALYNDKDVEDHFQLRAWVCVSNEFDVFTISKAIFQAIGGGDQSFANLNLLQVALKERLLKKKFLLVLDDVWNENYNDWELLQRPFIEGAPGSRVVVTTRKTTVTSAMDSLQPYLLEVLSDEAALSLFAQHALGEQNFDKHSKFRPHGEGIIKKCNGLPLALRTLGRVFKGKKEVEEWEELLDNPIWDLDKEGNILPALRLSYYDLSSHLKRLFAYCCLFPKDYMFDKDELVLLWMAEGFLHEHKKSMESFGREYFDELLSRSFLQQSTKLISGYVMHDLIHDLAMSVGGEFFFTLDDKTGNEASENVRHLSSIHQKRGEYRRFKALQRARQLRTFLSVKIDWWQALELSNTNLDRLLSQLKFVRVLNLSNHSISKVPQSVGSLIHIRYINLSRTKIKCLPHQITELYNLQCLLLHRCYNLSSLPNSFAKLINLRHVDIRDTPELKKLPSGMGGLTSLQTLSKVIIERDNGFKISDLKDLLHLRGQLFIKGMHSVRDGKEAKEANLHQKKDLEFLKMEWREGFDDSRNKMKEDEVLEGLRPNCKLRKLEIWYYGGTKFPSWVGDSSFNQLTELTLRGCTSCEYLPAVGQLQSLEVLRLNDMPSWERWSNSDVGNGIRATSFPCLREISIGNCPKLKKVSLDLIPSLRVLSIERCSEEVLRSIVGVSSSIVELTMEYIKGLIHLDEEFLKQLGKAEHLYISSCDELIYLWESESKACQFLASLKKLEVYSCDMLVSLGKEEDHLGINLTSPKEVVLHGCKRLKSYKCRHNIEKLQINGCGSMTSLTFPIAQDLPSSIKNIKIVECANLEGTWLLNNFLLSLESLFLRHSDTRMSFPVGWFVNLVNLSIWDCDNIESIPDKGFGFLPLFCLKTLEISRCKNLKAFPHKHLPRLTSLEELTITDCPSLDDSFPCGLWPPNLRSLGIGGLNKPMSEWGLQDFPASLVQLYLRGKNSGVVSFADAEDVRNNTTSSSFPLPPSLTCLDIREFEELESVLKGLQHLTCLDTLRIWSCQKLEDLPEKLLPSLLELYVKDCQKLEKMCRSGTGKYWPIVSLLPDFDFPILIFIFNCRPHLVATHRHVRHLPPPPPAATSAASRRYRRHHRRRATTVSFSSPPHRHHPPTGAATTTPRTPPPLPLPATTAIAAAEAIVIAAEATATTTVASRPPPPPSRPPRPPPSPPSKRSTSFATCLFHPSTILKIKTLPKKEAMVVAEIILSSFITVLFEKLASADLIKLAQSAGIYSELNKWKTTLTLIQKVLADAGQKHITDTAVEEWLNTLQNLAYDIDDLLDDLATEAMRHHLNKIFDATTSNTTNKVLKILAPFAPRYIKYGLKMRPTLDDITNRLHQLVEQKNILLLVENVDRPIRTSRRLEETSLVDESKIVGREKDKEALISKLFDIESSGRNFDVLSIVGLGGIGKTTLAKALYNDKKVEDHFELKAWVCVSDEFDVFTISNDIFKAVGGGNQSFANLNMLQFALKEKLLKKRFLLVLDNAWNEKYDEWELLQHPFVVGARGSKVMVTTRKTTITSVMGSVPAYYLEGLSNEAALSLFAQHALGEQNFDKHPTLKVHGEGIMKKCDGLPLALRTLGRVLRTKTNAEEWKELLTSAIWNSHNESKILPALRLSYYDLSSRLKRLFAYCCLFSKDYMFDKDELVLLWMAEGFLHEPNAIKSMERFGREYFEELVSRSFFQHSTDDISKYVMHDLINELAMSVGGKFFFTLDDKIGNEASENVRHLSFVPQKYRKFKALQRARRLRTFLSVPMHQWQTFELSNKMLGDLLPQLKLLRVLNLSNHSISEVPQSIGSLKHIRYINFSQTDITCLPDQVTELYNLQSLLLSGCYELSSLPNSFAKLINLRHLDIRITPKLNKLPSGIGGLTSLQTLPKVIIEGANGFKISDLKDLLHLQGQLCIEGLHNVRDGIEAKEANLQQKEDIDFLKLEWGNGFDDSWNTMKVYEVLEGLKPHCKLRNLQILYYGGMKFPSWVGDSSFNQLTELTLDGCRNCAYLPTVGQLQSLQKLVVASMNEVKTLDIEFLASASSFHETAFQSLQLLIFYNMQSWERWSNNDDDNGRRVTSFPRLREISIRKCPKLKEVSIDLIPSLQVLSIKGCSEEVLRSMVGVSSSIVELTMEYIEGLIQLDEELLKQLGKVEHLYISSCDELRYLWESESKACQFLASLKKLEVSRCDMLVSLGKEEDHLAINLTSPKEVRLEFCKSLKSYKCQHNTEKLKIERCGSLTSLTFPIVQDLPSSIKIIKIVGCEKLEESWFFNNFLSSLESLFLGCCDKVRLFPEGCFVNLVKLSICGCDNIESIPDEGFGFLPLFCLKTLSIRCCKNLKAFPHKHLARLTSLENLTITDCPSLDDSFPYRLWPPILRSLRIGCLNKPMSEWGLQDFPTSLVELYLEGKNSGLVSFVDAEDVRNNTTSSSFLLPPSLTCLNIRGFEDLKSVSKSLQHLTFLETLSIWSCPKLEDLPEELLPSLSQLYVRHCQKLEKMCCSETGKYWRVISQIPDFQYR
ncbi:hypothetical protein OSB04_023853 [Centaurea solstitialis]|uniref:Disease resistance RPP13-like protein 1 n=1 Tax=Centaurea solstitialis TaxID=347529 RepID=A0AA38WDB6_9ASTR|nr:hypothetical protein OSB04_023853 [Centaurea solstitialis]